MQELKATIKRGLTDRVSRKLIINKELIKFENKRFTKDAFTTFLKSEITDYRFGIFWLRLDVTFGRQYRIYIRNKENEVLKIAFKCYFGHKVNKSHELYTDILEALWAFHFSSITDDYLQRFEDGEELLINDVFFTKDGIRIKTDVALKEQDNFIPWENVRTKNYYSNFSIYSEDAPANINKGYSYMDDWNTTVLYSTLRTILKYKNIETYD